MKGRLELRLAEKKYIQKCAKMADVEIDDVMEVRDDLHIEFKTKSAQNILKLGLYIGDARREDMEKSKP